MAAAISVNKTNGPYEPMNITGSGFANNTPYVITAKDPMGHTRIINVASDGSGAFTAQIVPQTVGSYQFDVRPVTETTGTTSATASTTARSK